MKVINTVGISWLAISSLCLAGEIVKQDNVTIQYMQDNLTNADHIVEGRVISSVAALEHWPGGPDYATGVFTNVKLLISRNYKDVLKVGSHVLTIKLFGGLLSNVPCFSEYDALLTNGDSCIVFINRRHGVRDGISYDFLTAYRGWKSVYKIQNDIVFLDPPEFQRQSPQVQTLDREIRPVNLVEHMASGTNVKLFTRNAGFVPRSISTNVFTSVTTIRYVVFTNMLIKGEAK
jgi:hypothetical protein